MTFSLTAGVIRKENFAFAEMSCPVDHSHSEPRPAGTQRRATLQARCNQSFPQYTKRPIVIVSIGTAPSLSSAPHRHPERSTVILNPHRHPEHLIVILSEAKDLPVGSRFLAPLGITLS